MTSDQNKTRLGIVRCDTHAYWYGIFMDEVDPLVLANYHDDAPTRENVHHYFKTLGDPRHLKIERVEGFCLTAIYDRLEERDVPDSEGSTLQYGTYPGRAEAFSKTFLSRPKIYENLEQMAEAVDAVYVADSSSPRDGSDHLELVKPFLERGIPCFVDKPLAATLADAQEIIRLAQANNTTVMSASILAHCDVGKQFKQRFDEIGEPSLLVVKGKGPENAAVIHGIAAAQGLFGYGVEWVECMGSIPLECIQLYYPNGREAVVINAPGRVATRECTFYCSAYSNLGVIHAPGIGDPQFGSGTRRIVELFRKMIDTGKPSIPYEHILEPIAIIEAAKIAQREGQRVALKDICSMESVAH